ncbi:uncharacterized protein LOC134180788 [Corticium candelabrum]|uniref:uncharacterized protein LOC134180788 n=1 Tax=Corticium candelabrum TaxID=121492 RepID=UPI002E25353F|nr:uncharacterized protein LOC134180788 [Corticium candelabrum]
MTPCFSTVQAAQRLLHLVLGALMAKIDIKSAYRQILEQQLKHKTIICCISAVRHVHIQYGHKDLFASALSQLTYVLRGVRRSQGEGPTRQRLPITPKELRATKPTWSQQPLSYDTVMLLAAFCPGLFGFLRVGEFTVSSFSSFEHASHLTSQYITTDSHENPFLVRLHLKWAKTDLFCCGADVYLGRSANDICSVSSLLAYMVDRSARSGPFFIFIDSCPLSSVRLVQEVQRALSPAGLDCSGYTGHSFQIGAATTAKALDIDDSSIKKLLQ